MTRKAEKMFHKLVNMLLLILCVGVVVGFAVQVAAEFIRGFSDSGWDSLAAFLVAWALGTAALFWFLRKRGA